MKAQIWEIWGTEGQLVRLCVPVHDESADYREIVADWIVENFDDKQRNEVGGINKEMNAYTTRKEPFVLSDSNHSFENFIKTFLNVNGKH